MKNIYLLKSLINKTSIFIDDPDYNNESISTIAMKRNWKPFSKYTSVKLKLVSSDDGKKNYRFDICSFLKPFYIFSEQAIDVLKSILIINGQILPVTTESKRKKFWGYYPTNIITGCFDRKNSEFREYEKGLFIEKVVLKKNHIPESNLFVIEEDPQRTFITETFKKYVEKNNLYGFDFSTIIQIK